MTLVFDFDGTLHNTTYLYGGAFREGCKWLEEQGYHPTGDTSDENVSKYIGVSAPDTWADFMPELPEDIAEKVIAKVGEGLVSRIEAGKAKLYDGVPEMLDKLKKAGYQMFILSNSDLPCMDAHIRNFELYKWFDDFFPGEAYGFIPKKEIFRILTEQYPDDEYIMVGDRDSDMEIGTIEKVKTIGCTYGFGTKEELSVADMLAASPAEVAELILGEKL